MDEDTLLIPGATAAFLDDQNGVNVWNAVRAGLGVSIKELGDRPREKWVPLLSMSHTPGEWAPTRSSLEPGTTISATGIATIPYDRLLESGVKGYPYDWRADLRHNAKLLLKFLRDNQPAGKRWNLIGHSEGCFVIVVASKLAETPHDFAALVGRVILVASPLAGTMGAAEALIFGSDDLGSENQALASAMTRTWPAFYQMLPSWGAVLDPRSDPLPRQRQLVSPDGWPAAERIPADMLLRARELQALLTGPFSSMGPGVASLVILGQNQQTPVTVVRDGDAFLRDRETFEVGDTLVPFDRTIKWGGLPFAGHTLTVKGGREHSWLCEEDETLDAIRRWLKRSAPPIPGPINA